MDFRVVVEAFKLPMEAVEQCEEYAASGEGTIGYQAEWAYNNAGSTSETMLPGLSPNCTADELGCDLSGAFTVPRRGPDLAVRYPLSVYLYEHCFHASGRKAASTSPASSCCVGSVTIDLNRHIPDGHQQKVKQRATLFLDKCPYRFPNPIMVRLTIQCTLVARDSPDGLPSHPPSASMRSASGGDRVASASPQSQPVEAETEEERVRKVQAGVDAAKRRVASARAQRIKSDVSRTSSAQSNEPQKSSTRPQPTKHIPAAARGVVKASSKTSNGQGRGSRNASFDAPPNRQGSGSEETRSQNWRQVDPRQEWQSPSRESQHYDQGSSYNPDRGYQSPSSTHSPPQPVLSPPIMSPPPLAPVAEQRHSRAQSTFDDNERRPVTVPPQRQDSVSQDVFTALVHSNTQLKEDNEKLKRALEIHILNSLKSPSPERSRPQEAEVKAKLEAAQKELALSQEDAAAVRAQLEEREARIKELERDVHMKGAALEEAHNDTRKWQEHYRAQERDIAKLEAHIESISISVREEAATENRALKTKLLDAEKDAREARRDNDRLEDALADAQDACERCERRLEEEARRRQEADVTLDQTLKETAEKIERYEASLRLGQTELQRLHTYAEDMNKKCNELARVVASQNTVLGKRNDKIHELQGIISALEVRAAAQRREAESKVLSYPPSLQPAPSPLGQATPQRRLPTSFLQDGNASGYGHADSTDNGTPWMDARSHLDPNHDPTHPVQWSRPVNHHLTKTADNRTTEVILSPPRNPLSTGRFTGGATPTTYANSAASRMGYVPPRASSMDYSMSASRAPSVDAPISGVSPSPRLPQGYTEMIFTSEDRTSPRQRNSSSRPPPHHHNTRSASTRGPSEGLFSNDSQLIPRGPSRSQPRSSVGRDPMADPDL